MCAGIGGGIGHFHNDNYIASNHSYSSINLQQFKESSATASAATTAPGDIVGNDGSSLSTSQTDCVLKCTCQNNTNYNSAKSLTANSSASVTNGGTTNYNELSQIKIKNICDAATSPGRISNNCQRSPKMNKDFPTNLIHQMPIKNNINAHKCNNENLIDFQKHNKLQCLNKSYGSPRRSVTTRNAATSPHLDIRKINNNNNVKRNQSELLKTPEMNNRLVLEKSNSLGESKPLRQLRTTRSLSPRPPVRHQHAITVSDENDIVSVKVSPNEDFIDLTAINNLSNNIVSTVPSIVAGAAVSDIGDCELKNNRKTGTKKKYKAKSEHNSPNLCADIDSVFIYDKKGVNNKSTGCLVYVPSDPWLKMSDISNDPNNKDGSSSLRKKPMTAINSSKFLSKQSRSLSRNDMEPLNNIDPWIWRNSQQQDNTIKKSININNSNITTKSPKHDIFRQTKSISTTKYEISDNFLKYSRPKLQRSKSPLIIDDDKQQLVHQQQQKQPQSPSSPYLIAPDPQYTIYNYPPVTKVRENGNNNNNNNSCEQQRRNSSPRKDICDKQKIQRQLPPPPPPPLTQTQLNKSHLNVVNTNLLQARHSFSSVSPQKDDELQLNIRRLSEQIKHNQNITTTIGQKSGGADFSDYLQQFRNSEAKKAAAAEAVSATVLTVDHITKSPRNSANKKSDKVLETTC